MAAVFVPLVMKHFDESPHCHTRILPDATWVEKGLRDLEPINSKVIVVAVGKFVVNLRKQKFNSTDSYWHGH